MAPCLLYTLVPHLVSTLSSPPSLESSLCLLQQLFPTYRAFLFLPSHPHCSNEGTLPPHPPICSVIASQLAKGFLTITITPGGRQGSYFLMPLSPFLRRAQQRGTEQVRADLVRRFPWRRQRVAMGRAASQRRFSGLAGAGLRSQHSGRKCRWVLLNLAFRFTPPHFFLGLFVT